MSHPPGARERGKKGSKPDAIVSCRLIRAAIPLSLSFSRSPCFSGRNWGTTFRRCDLERSIAFLVYLVSALQPTQLEVAVDDGCNFQYLLNGEGRSWTAVIAQTRGTRLVPVRVLRKDIVTST